MNRAALIVATLLLACAALPPDGAAQRRPVPERSGTPVRGTVTPRGNQEGRAFSARPAHARSSTTCSVFVTAPLKGGVIEWWPSADDRLLWVDVPATTGRVHVGPDNRGVRRGSTPQVGIVSIEALDVDRITLSVTAPTRLRGGGAGIPFTGEWAVSDRRKTGYIPMAGPEREVVLPPSGRIYVRLGGRVAFTPEDLPKAKQGQQEEFLAEWLVHVSSAADAGDRTRIADCLHMVSVPVSAVLQHPTSSCTLTAVPTGLDFGAAQRTRAIPGAGFPHDHAITVDPTTTPAEVTLADATNDHFVGTPSGKRGWLAIETEEQEAFIIFEFPATVDHDMPPDDLTTADVTEIPYAPTLAYYEGTSATGDEFTSIDLGACQGCQINHRIPPNTRHEYATGGTITFDQASGGGNIGGSAIPGQFTTIISVSLACS